MKTYEMAKTLAYRCREPLVQVFKAF